MPSSASDASIPCQEPRRWLLAAIGLSVLLSLVLIVRSPCVGRDGPTFIWLAQDLSHDFTRTLRGADQHPGYPMLILASHSLRSVFGASADNASWAISARIVSLLFGVLLVTVVWLLARRIFDGRVAGIAAVLVAIVPLFCESASNVWSDTPHLAFFLLATWLLLEGLSRGRWTWFLGAGVAAGLAFWIRPEGLAPALVGGLVLAWRVARPTDGRARVLLWGASLTIGLLALVAPYVLIKGKLTAKKDLTRVVARSDAPAASSALSTPDEATARPAPVTPAPPPPVSEVVSLRLTRAGNGLVRLVDRVLHGLRYFLLAPVLIALCLPGRRRPQPVGALFVGVFLVFYVATLVVVFVAGGYLAERHVMPLLILGLIWSAVGIVWVAERALPFLEKLSPGAIRWSPARACAFWIAICVLVLLPRSLRPSYDHAVTLRNVSLWIASQSAPGDALLSNTYWAPFYADLPERRSPQAFAEDLRAGPEKHYRFIVFYKEEVGWDERQSANLSAYRRIGREEAPTPDGRVEAYIRR